MIHIDIQFNFKNVLSIKEALYYIKLLVQKYYDQRKNIFIRFIIYQTAFDDIHNQLISSINIILQETSNNEKDTRIIHKHRN
jgi:hypothetical protein